jgi:SAM-dependent methyltransferase
VEKNIDKYWKTYEDVYGFEDVLRHFRHAEAAKFLSSSKPKKVLEVGCGYTPLFLAYDSYEHYSVIEPGKEPYDAVVEMARGNNRIQHYNKFLEEVGASDLDGPFDAIVLPGLLHEVADPENFLEKLRRFTKSDTKVYINVPNSKSFHRLLAIEMGLITYPAEMTERNVLLGQVTNFSLDDLVSTVRHCFQNCNILEAGTFFIKPFTHNQMSRIIDMKIVPISVVDGLSGLSRIFPNNGSEISLSFEVGS